MPGDSGAVFLKAGVVYRGDSYISDEVVEVRYGLLWSDGFITKRRKDSSGNGKVWPLNKKCRLKPIEQKSLTVLRSSHTILSLVYGRYDSKKLFCFKVQWQSRGVLAKESLLLAFEARDTAVEWYDHFESAISSLQAQAQAQATKPGSKALKKTLKARDASHTDPSQGQDCSQASHEGDWTNLAGTSSELPPMEPLTPHAAAASMHEDFSQNGGDSPEWKDSESMEASLETAWVDDDVGTRGVKRTASFDARQLASWDGDVAFEPFSKDWAPFRVLNGLAVYKEEELDSGHGGAYMLSGTMKSSPKTCFDALMDINNGRCNIWAFTEIVKAIKIDQYSHVIQALMSPQGSWGKLLRPREVVLQRSWRLEEDGSYIVVFSSVDYPGIVPTPHAQRAQIDAMNFTIAPLKAPAVPLQREATSVECLVTVVLKADLGGIFSRNSWFVLLPFVDSWQRHWIETLLMTVVALRDKVEQDRFVVRPETVRMGNKVSTREPAVAVPSSPSRFLSSRTNAGGADSVRAGYFAPLQRNSPSDSDDEVRGGGPPSEMMRSCRGSSDTDDASKGASPTTPPVWLDHKYWTCPGSADFKVRGATYLADRKKQPSEAPVFSLQGVELVKMPTTTYHVSRYLPAVRHSVAPFNFVLCFTLPYGGQIHGLALIFAADCQPNAAVSDDAVGGSQDESSQDDHEKLPPFDLNLVRFLTGDDSVRNSKLKLIPSLAVGSWIMRQAVGQTPVMLGKKLKSVYFSGPGYFEVDIDINSNSTAANITSMVAGAIKSLVFDIGILLEGHSEEELPERLLGSARLVNLDLSMARTLDTSVELEQVPRSACID